MSAQNVGRVKKYFRKRKFKKNEVLKIISLIMEKQATTAGEGNPNDYHNEFFNTGRIGRRNALPDILSYNCTTSTADLPARLSALTTKDSQTSGASILDRNEPSTSQACTSSPRIDGNMTTTISFEDHVLLPNLLTNAVKLFFVYASVLMKKLYMTTSMDN